MSVDSENGLPPASAQAMTEHAEEAASFLRALANDSRLMVLCRLIDGEHTVSALQERLPLSQSALSQHLALLRREGLVATRRASQNIYYRLADRRVERTIGLLYELFCNEGHR